MQDLRSDIFNTTTTVM